MEGAKVWYRQVKAGGGVLRPKHSTPPVRTKPHGEQAAGVLSPITFKWTGRWASLCVGTSSSFRPIIPIEGIFTSHSCFLQASSFRCILGQLLHASRLAPALHARSCQHCVLGLEHAEQAAQGALPRHLIRKQGGVIRHTQHSVKANHEHAETQGIEDGGSNTATGRAGGVQG